MSAKQSTRSRKQDFKSYTVRDQPDATERVIGLKDSDFQTLAKAAGGGLKVQKEDKATERTLGELRMLGLVRFTFRQDTADGWPYPVAILTAAGAQALAQDPAANVRGA